VQKKGLLVSSLLRVGFAFFIFIIDSSALPSVQVAIAHRGIVSLPDRDIIVSVSFLSFFSLPGG